MLSLGEINKNNFSFHHLYLCGLFRLGNEKYKSKVVWRSLNPRWLEQFDLHLYDDGDQQLEVTVWDKDRSRDDFIGR